MHGDLGYQSDYEGTEGPRHRPDGENGPSVAKSTIVNSLHFADYTLRLDRFYFSSGEGEDTQRCVGLENKRKKIPISLQSTFLGTFYFGDVSNSKVLLVGYAGLKDILE